MNSAPGGASVAIDARSIGRRFGARWVLRGLTFAAEAGETIALIGENGSGKSTLLRIISTLLAPSSGSASVCGRDVTREADAVRHCIGYLPHASGLYDDLTARENLRFAGEMLGLESPPIDALLERVGLDDMAHERVRQFSAGMQRRLALARLLLRRPQVMLLDEPYANLDAAGITLMNEIIESASARGGAALIVLHELAPASRILDRTISIVNGRIAQPPTETRGAESPRRTTLAIAGAIR